MRQYLDALQQVCDNGVKKGDRTGTGTTEVFGVQTRYDLADGFPAMTTKKLYFTSVAHELLWFLEGTGNIEYLAQNGVHIWDEWPYKNYLEKTGQNIPEINGEEWRAGMKLFIDKIANDHAFAEEWGDLGPVYGVQWRKWPDGKGGTIDQIQNAIDMIRRRGATLSAPGTWRKLTTSCSRVDCRRAIRCSSSMFGQVKMMRKINWIWR